MNPLIRRSINFFAISFFTLIIGAACDKDMSVMLDNSATSNVGVTLVDSFTAQTYTVHLTYRPTASTATLPVQKCDIPPGGAMQSTAYLSVEVASLSNDIAAAATIDALCLIIRPSPNTYSFGHTTEIQQMNVHEFTPAW